MTLLILIQMTAFILANICVLDFWDMADGVAGRRAAADLVAGLFLVAIAFCYTAPQLPLLAPR